MTSAPTFLNGCLSFSLSLLLHNGGAGAGCGFGEARGRGVILGHRALRVSKYEE